MHGVELNDRADTPWKGPLLVAVTAPVLKNPKLCGGPEWAWTATTVLETALTAIFLEDVASIAAGRSICRAAPSPDWPTTPKECLEVATTPVSSSEWPQIPGRRVDVPMMP